LGKKLCDTDGLASAGAGGSPGPAWLTALALSGHCIWPRVTSRDLAELKLALDESPLTAHHVPFLMGRTSARSFSSHHLNGLDKALRQDPSSAHVRARVSYHAIWLLHSLFPTRAEFLPSVTVLIPAYNTGDKVRDAVASALAQTYQRTEVLVVDDGSTDQTPDILAAFGERIRVIRSANGGCASARNSGIAACTTHFIHLLDSDDLLHPRAIELKIGALLAIPDAELVCSRYRSVGDDGHRSAREHEAPPFGDRYCPTRDLLTCTSVRYPFSTITVLLPRCVFLETGPMDTFLARGSDARYWFRLGLRRIKVVAIDMPLATRRFRIGSLTSEKLGHRRAGLRHALLALADVLEHRETWPWAHMLSVKLTSSVRWRHLNHEQDACLTSDREQLLQRIAALPSETHLRGAYLSPRLPLLAIQAELKRRWRNMGVDSTQPDLFFGRATRVIAESLLKCEPPTLVDVQRYAHLAAESGCCYGRAVLDELADVLRKKEHAPRELADIILIGELMKGTPHHLPWQVSRCLFPLLDYRALWYLRQIVGLAVNLAQAGDRIQRKVRKNLKFRTRLRSILRKGVLSGQ